MRTAAAAPEPHGHDHLRRGIQFARCQAHADTMRARVIEAAEVGSINQNDKRALLVLLAKRERLIR